MGSTFPFLESGLLYLLYLLLIQGIKSDTVKLFRLGKIAIPCSKKERGEKVVTNTVYVTIYNGVNRQCRPLDTLTFRDLGNQ